MEKPKLKKRGKRRNYNILYVLISVTILILTANTLTLSIISKTISEKMADFQEENRPANVQLAKILYSDCGDCYNIDRALDQIKGLKVNITEEKELQWNSQEAESLIDRYDIDVLPTIVITGETEKSNVESSWTRIGEVKDDGTVIFTKQKPPYYDTVKQTVVGLVSTINLVDSSCSQCIDMGRLVDSFQQAGVVISDEKTLEYNSQEAKELIEKFDIQKIPALIISKDVTEYDAINQIWSQLNAFEKEGFYILHALQPPYRDLSTGEIVGLVSLVNLVDESCSDCYSVSAHKPILLRFGIAIANETTYDINSSEGEKLIEKYSITRVPTILLSPEATAYSALNQVWVQVGTVEDDGWYVFRSIEALGDVVYTDLTTTK